MASTAGTNDVPGTVLLEDRSGTTATVTLQPRPSKDPNDPLNWPLWRKNLNFGLALYYVLMVFALIDVNSVTWAPMNEQLGFTWPVLTDSWAVSCGSLAIVGPFLIPFAIKFGRRPIYIFSTLAQACFAVWLARQETVADLMLTNIATNFVGALAEVLVQMTVADLFFVHQRGRYNTGYFFVMAFGSAIPTTIAGYIAVNQGWRWVWWWLVILIGVGLGAFVFLYEETSYTRLVVTTPTVGFQNEKQLESENKASSPKSHVIEVVEIDESIPRRTYRQKLAFWTTNELTVNDMFWISIEPFLMLYQFPIVIFVALFYGVTTACITVTATTNGNQLPLPPYNFNPSEIGLMNIPSFLGLVVAFVIYAPFADRSMLYFARMRGGIYEPESRLYPALLSILFIPAGLFLYGVSLDKGDHWTLPAAGIFLLSFGSAIPSAAALTYLTDSYTEIVGPAYVGVTFVRNIISMAFIFIQPPWIGKTGLTWFYVGFGLIVTFVTMGIPLCIVFGKRFRARSARKYRLYAGHLRGGRFM